MSTRIELYYDVISPFVHPAYIAFEILKMYRHIWHFELMLQPMFLGGVMGLSGNKPPLSIPNKGKWVNKDSYMTADYWNIDFKMPDPFPFNTLFPMRVLKQLQTERPDLLEDATSCLYRAVFSHTKQDVTNSASLLDILQGLGGLNRCDLEGIIQRSQQDENKQALTNATVQLVEKHEAFGAPWLIVHREDGQSRSFWGADRFESMAWWMNKPWKGPLDRGNRQAKL